MLFPQKKITFFQKNSPIFAARALSIAEDTMPKKNNYTHDSGYKLLFSNHELVRQLITSFVTDDWVHEIDFNSLERLEKSFVSEDFVERESDIIYKASFRGCDLYFYILIEFQSKVDRFMSLRMLHYICEFYEDMRRNNNARILPAVFPLMLYNGKNRWTAPEEIATLIEQTIPGGFIPRFRYFKIAENEFDTEFLCRLNNAVGALFLAENCRPEKLEARIDDIVQLLRNERPQEVAHFVNWFKRAFLEQPECVAGISSLTECESMLRETAKEIKRQSRLEGLHEGIQKGIQKGRTQGLHEGKSETAMRMLEKGFEIEVIAEVTGLSIKDVHALKKDMH